MQSGFGSETLFYLPGKDLFNIKSYNLKRYFIIFVKYKKRWTNY